MSNIRNKNFQDYSEEVQEILGIVPRWIVRWGITVFFLIFITIITCSYFFKYPVVISTPLVLTTINPPVPLICRSSGRISKLFVTDGQRVHPEKVIALIENDADYYDIKIIDSIINNFKSNWVNQVKMENLPDNLSLGTLQYTFINFQKTYNNLGYYIEQDLIGKKIMLLEIRILTHKKQYKLILKQWEIKRQEFRLVKSIFMKDSIAYYKGGYGIIKTNYENSFQSFLAQKSSILSYELSVRNEELNLLQLKENLLELKLSKEINLNKYINVLDEALVSLQTQLNDWFKSYILTSPIDGKITFTNFWSENQVINIGEHLATIIPDEETLIIARSVIPSSSLGKIAIGQKVNIKLLGFPYLEHGILIGRIKTISLVPGEEGYVAEILLEEGMKSTYGETLEFFHQMDGTADIITEETRLIYSFINPLRKFANN